MKNTNKTLSQWLDKLEKGHNKKIDLGLSRIRTVYNRLNIDKPAHTVITVAGTNGKGSTVAILSSICQQAGYKVGVFTSPHLIRFNERIKINNCEAKDQEIVRVFELIELHLNETSLSYFEYATLAALIIFKSNWVDVAVLEVGLGGRLDSVNVVDSDCAIITTIAIDHTDWLGNDIESIAFEKAGIMRQHKPTVYGDDPCPQSIIDYAKTIQSQLIFTDQSLQIPAINLAGEYQKTNAKTAITALNLLKKKLNINPEHINLGLQAIQLKGRLQTIAQNPQIIIDVSHNEQAIQSLVKWLKCNPIEGRTLAVFAVLNDKNAIKWLSELMLVIDVWCISEVKSDRGLSRHDLLLALSGTPALITSFKSVKKAFESAKVIANKEDRIIVFGSFYTVGEVLVG